MNTWAVDRYSRTRIVAPLFAALVVLSGHAGEEPCLSSRDLISLRSHIVGELIPGLESLSRPDVTANGLILGFTEVLKTSRSRVSVCLGPDVPEDFNDILFEVQLTTAIREIEHASLLTDPESSEFRIRLRYAVVSLEQLVNYLDEVL